MDTRKFQAEGGDDQPYVRTPRHCPAGTTRKWAILDPFFLALTTASWGISLKNKVCSSESVEGIFIGPILDLGTRTYSAWPPGIPPCRWLKPNKAGVHFYEWDLKRLVIT